MNTRLIKQWLDVLFFVVPVSILTYWVTAIVLVLVFNVEKPEAIAAAVAAAFGSFIGIRFSKLKGL